MPETNSQGSAVETSEQRIKEYQARADELEVQIGRLTAPLGWLLAIRGVILIALLVSAVFTLVTVNLWSGLLTLVLAPAFVWSAYRHEKCERLRKIAALRRRYDLNSVARLKRQWQDVPVPKTEVPDHLKSLSNDLDLFGRSSVFQWLCIARTPMGKNTFRQWLMEPAEPAEVSQRQEAVEQLKNQQDYLGELQLRAELLTASRNGPNEFVAWAEGPRWLDQRKWLLYFARFITILLFVVFFALGFGFLDKGVGGITIVVAVAINLLLSLWYAGRIHDIFNAVATRQIDIMNYRRLFEHADDVPGDSEMLTTIRAGLREGQRPALQSVAELGLVMSMANLRRAGLFGLFYLVLQFLFLWDVHWLAVLEQWHKRHGMHVRGWFETLGRLEAIMCLAKLAFDQPSWNFPSVKDADPTESMVHADEMGHPLLPDQGRVCNSVSVGPPGTVLLVTGSNMSGKSTLLRSLGVNLVLAQAGSVVCAKSMSLPPVELATSMRIHDSLADGVSFYMAELKRLKSVVDQARERQGQPGPRLFFLLDEILQGTNSKERHVAVSRVVHHLVDSGAIGAVSTHDLELVNAPGLDGKCETVHFRESFEKVNGRDKMVFDYQMRPGIATTTNALKLLSMVGLDEANLEESSASGDKDA